MRRRVFRILINALTMFSLLLCLGTCVLWGRNRATEEMVVHDDQLGSSLREVGISFCNGIVACWWFEDAYRREPGFHHYRFNRDPAQDFIGAEMSGSPGGFRFGSFAAKNGFPKYRSLRAFFPAWSLFMTTLILPSIAIVRAAHLKLQTAQGRCAICGYDLRATPDRFPECGTVQ